MRRVIISPHLDDETLCLGGAIAKWSDKGDYVHIIELFCADTSVCNGEIVEYNTRVQELCEVQKILGFNSFTILKTSMGYEDDSNSCPIGSVVSEIENMPDFFDSDEVYFPCATEHQDHEFGNRLGKILMRASANKGKAFYEYPMPYRALDNVLEGEFIDITHYKNIKEHALSKYSSQMRENGVISSGVVAFNTIVGQIYGSGRSYEKVIPKRRFV